MLQDGNRGPVLLAEDDDDDFLLIQEAFAQLGLSHALQRVRDGEELLDHLSRQPAPPSLLLLDLNMPRKDGREVLREIRHDSRFHYLPVVALTTSNNPDDVTLSYQMGASSFVHKPTRFGDLVQVVKTLLSYWFEIVELPGRRLTPAPQAKGRTNA
jgi:CheY-like chemotaxis protein